MQWTRGRPADHRRRRRLAAQVDVSTWAAGVLLLESWHRIWWSLVLISLLLRVLVNMWSTRSRIGMVLIDLVRVDGIVSALNRAAVGRNPLGVLVAGGFAYAVWLTVPDLGQWRPVPGDECEPAS